MSAIPVRPNNSLSPILPSELLIIASLSHPIETLSQWSMHRCCRRARQWWSSRRWTRPWSPSLPILSKACGSPNDIVKLGYGRSRIIVVAAVKDSGFVHVIIIKDQEFPLPAHLYLQIRQLSLQPPPVPLRPWDVPRDCSGRSRHFQLTKPLPNQASPIVTSLHYRSPDKSPSPYHKSHIVYLSQPHL